jgi:hypothetical protein
MKCACKSPDKFLCWAHRYNSHPNISTREILNEGGPCSCECHSEEKTAHTPADGGRK